MKTNACILAFGLLVHVAMGQPKELKQLSPQLDKILEEQFKSGKTGGTALVSHKGQVIYQKAFGMANLELNVPMQSNHVFRIGSITKQFTAVAILQLMEQGKLNLQDEITRFIPDYPTHGHKITIEHLLTHTSGIQSYTGMKDFQEKMTQDLEPAQMIDHFKNQPMNFAPGTRWEYSNSGYFLLGYIIEKITGKTYAEYLEENFFEPLGMTSTCYGSNTKIIRNRVGTYTKVEDVFENAPPLSMSQPYAAGSILSTVEDLFKWHQAVHAGKLVKKENLDKAFTRYRLINGQEVDYGYGWFLSYVQGSPAIEHGGGINGTLTMSIYLPGEDVFVAVFSNCDCISPKEMASKMAALTIGKPYDHKEIKLEEATLQGYPGVYENEKGELRIITLSQNQLYSQRGKAPRLMIKAFQKDHFFFDDAMMTLVFSRDEKGEITQIISQGRNANEVWVKTDKPIPVETLVRVDEKILETYVGEYAITAQFGFTVTKEQDKLFVQATDQEKIEIFAETESKWYLKVNGAQLEFVKDPSGKITKLILDQGGRKKEALKTK